MKHPEPRPIPRPATSPTCGSCCHRLDAPRDLWPRRRFLSGVGGTLTVLSALGWLESRAAQPVTPEGVIPGQPLPPGVPLRLKPVLVYSLDQPRERTSWRSYGGLRTREDVERELHRLEDELQSLASQAEFPLRLEPLSTISGATDARKAAAGDADAFLILGASGAQEWIETLLAAGKPCLLFVRHRSGPVYLWYEIAHWRLLRKSEDAKVEPNLDFDDVIVDDWSDVLWRARALYGLQNARGTTMLALGGLSAYSGPGQQLGPAHAEKIWGYHIKSVSHDELRQRLAAARANPAVLDEAERQAARLLAMHNVRLDTDRRFVVNTYVALNVIKDLMREQGATNVGVGDCMGGLIPIFDTPPCLALAELNDEGATAFCHTDLTHTMPGVLMRWISGKPSFVCNSHFPHHGQLTLAHCAAPRKMNGRDFEPTTLMTHYESDYGVATKVHYPAGQVITCIVPNLHCSKWFAFRARIADSPAYDMCRSQMNVRIDGDWRRLTRELEGFHTVVTYGDYLREAGYAVGKIGAIEWKNYSSTADEPG